jgi:hypothetical protein
MTKLKMNCYCIDEVLKPIVTASGNDYDSPAWSAAVLRKVQIAIDLVRSSIKHAFLVDHDVVVHMSIDDVFNDDKFMRTPIVTM